MTCELVYCYSGELLFFRLQNIYRKLFNSGVIFSCITVIIDIHTDEKDVEYLRSLDYLRVIDYRNKNYKLHGELLDIYMQEDARADTVFFLHLDAFPLQDNWAKDIYYCSVSNRFGCFMYQNGGVDYWTVFGDVFCVQRKWFLEHNLYFRFYEQDTPLFPEMFNGKYVGLPYTENRWVYDTGTVICGWAYLQNGFPELSMKIHNKYFYHLGAGAPLYWGIFNHVLPQYIHQFRNFIFGHEINKDVMFLLKNDGCLVKKYDPLLELVI